LTTQLLTAQSVESLKIKKHKKKCKRYNHRIFRILKLPNTTASPSNLRDNADFIMSMMSRKLKNVQLLEGETVNSTPAVYGEVLVPGAKQTLIFYAHYDGQPVNPDHGIKPKSFYP
jgi:acetylornithine deacetylase/succinyl-diaminopimelate desuccinylase-like protein